MAWTAIIIGEETTQKGTKSSYWLSHHGALLLVAREHLRPAAMEESLANGVVAQMLGDLVEELAEGAPVYHDLRPDGVEVPPATLPADTREVVQNIARQRAGLDEPDYEPPAPPTPIRENVTHAPPTTTATDDADTTPIEAATLPDGYGPIRTERTMRGDPVYNVWLLEMKSSMKSKKGRELDDRKFNDEEKDAFDLADKEQWEKHVRNGAVEVIPLDESERILKHSREHVVPGFARFV